VTKTLTTGFCSLIDRDTLLNEIMTSVEDLVSDPSQHVRAALGTQISGLAPILGKEESVSWPYMQMRMISNLSAGLSPICFLCSFRCSRTSSPTYDSTSSLNWSWLTKVWQTPQY
jgi:hypothetical protein